MNKIFLHIPHSGKKLPNILLKNTIISKDNIMDFYNLISDTKVDKLFGKNFYNRIVFKYSRIFCDVERYSDDENEEMSKFGMGVVYTKTNQGVQFAEFDDEYKKYVLEKYYYPYHEKLDRKVNKLLLKNDVILVDCHSFSKDIIMFEDRKENLPDICVGYNDDIDVKLADFVCDFFEEAGYKVAKNYPYSGSMVPNNLVKDTKGHKFQSIMIEVNKVAYLYDKDKIKKLQKCINMLLKELECFI